MHSRNFWIAFRGFIPLIFVAWWCAFSCGSSSANVGIVAAVGRQVLSTVDVIKMVNVMRILYNVPQVSEEAWPSLVEQALSNLVDSIILEKRAISSGISVRDADVIAYIDAIRTGLRMEPEQFKKLLADNKVDGTIMTSMARSKVIWSHIMHTEIETRATVISKKELTDSAATINNSIAAFNAAYEIRQREIKHSDIANNAGYMEGIERFAQTVKSCDDADAMAASFGLRGFSAPVSAKFSDLDTSIQAAIVSMAEGTVASVVNGHDNIRVLLVCNVTPSNEKALGADDDIEKTRSIIAQQKRAQAVHRVLGKMRSENFVDIRELPTYQQYLDWMSSV